MTGPAVGGEETTLDEATRIAGAPAPTKLDEVKIDGEEVPDEFKGKSVREVLQIAKGAKDSLVQADLKRKEAEDRLALAAAAPREVVQPPPPIEEPKEMTDEEFNTLYQQEPAKAIRLMQEQSERRVLKNLEQRIGPLAGGSAASAEAAARARYPDEFEILGTEIAAAKAAIRNQEAMALPKSWDDLVAYVRGLPGNFEKFIEGRAKKTRDKQQQEAHDREAAAAGPVTRSTTVVETPTGGAAGVDKFGLDAAQRAAADAMNISYEEYAKWLPPKR